MSESNKPDVSLIAMWRHIKRKKLIGEDKKMKKTTLILVIALSLFASIALFADDGNQGSGTLREICSNPADCPPVCVQGCPMPVANLDTPDEPTLDVYVEEFFVEVTKEAFDLVLY